MKLPLLECWVLGLVAIAVLGGCTPEPETAIQTDDPPDEVEAPSNRLAIPSVVRNNLGITFARAEYRPVASTVTLPGYFEVLPSAQYHYPVPAAGRVAVHVDPLQRVEAGQLLLEIDAPDWRALQLAITEARADRLTREAQVARARAARLAAGSILDFAQDEDATPDVFTTEIDAALASVGAAEERFERMLAHAATLTGLTSSDLLEEVDGEPAWRRLNAIPIRASSSGVVREVDTSTGSWVGQGTEVVHVVHPEKLRFRARALQADLIDRIRDGQSASITPPEGRGARRRAEPVRGTVRIGVTGDPATRTTDVFIDFGETAEWVRPQVVAVADVIVAGSDEPIELAIPSRAVIRDGLETVFFRRAPADPDAVIRTIADLGATDGRWTTILSGLSEGDEVVVDGVYPLKLASTGQKTEAGHFHADGTFHEGDD